MISLLTLLNDSMVSDCGWEDLTTFAIRDLATLNVWAVVFVLKFFADLPLKIFSSKVFQRGAEQNDQKLDQSTVVEHDSR